MGAGDARLRAVVGFADNVLRHGRDTYGSEPTPLLADGLDVDTREPVRWTYSGTRHRPGAWVVSNLALQQNLFRTLVGLSGLTGDPRFRDAAAAAVAFHFDQLASPCGLLRWGGHQFVDLRTKTPQGPFMGDVHEFKHTYPFYELLAEVRPEATARFVRAFWNAHVIDWATLDMSRHGHYGKPMGALWASRFDEPAAFFEGSGLTFVNCGSDLVFAAAALYRLSGDAGALAWAKRLDRSYVRARHPRTGLGVYQYSSPRAREAAVAGSTLSVYGDRALRQLGPEFGEIAREGNVLDPRRAESIYGRHAVIELGLAEELRQDEFREWALAGLRACASWIYDPERHVIRPLLADGTDLTGFALRRDGYYGRAGTVFQARRPAAVLLWSLVLGHRLSGDGLLWSTARAMARGHGLGDIGTAPGEGVRPAAPPDCADPDALFAVLEMYATVPHPAYLELARAIGDNILAQRFHAGYFLPSPAHAHARFDAVEPLALLALEGVLRGRPADVPPYRTGKGFLDGYVDDRVRTTDERAIWSRLRTA